MHVPYCRMHSTSFRKKKKLLGLYGDSFRLKPTSFLFINLKKIAVARKKEMAKKGLLASHELNGMSREIKKNRYTLLQKRTINILRITTSSSPD